MARSHRERNGIHPHENSSPELPARIGENVPPDCDRHSVDADQRPFGDIRTGHRLGPARLKLLADKGRKGAATATRLAEDPGRFLSSVQIGITLAGILAGALLGARLEANLIDAGMPSDFAQPVGVGSVVLAITYLSLIVGELVPKQIALLASLNPFNAPCDCPQCASAAPRVLINAPRLAVMSGGSRRAHETNERSADSPERSSHGPRCACCCSFKGRLSKTLHYTNGAKSFPTKRPWMISH